MSEPLQKTRDTVPMLVYLSDQRRRRGPNTKPTLMQYDVRLRLTPLNHGKYKTIFLNVEDESSYSIQTYN